MKPSTINKHEAKQFDKNAAKVVDKLFSDKIKEVSNRATNGDRKAAMEFMQLVTDKSWTLRRLGYMHGRNGRLVKFKPYIPPSHLVT